MPRQPRIHVPGAFYHVTLRGNHRRDIFFEPSDRQLLDDIVAEVIEGYGARVHAYCWMSNHTHMLLQVGDTPLGRVILRIASRYARQTQARLRTTGHLFERRYHAVLIDADAYLLELLRYIHLNPVRAGMVASVDAYPWSSHAAYLGHKETAWLTTDVALRYFSTDQLRARHVYRDFVDEQLTVSESPLLQRNPNDSRILGDDNFAAALLGEAWTPRSRWTLDDLITQGCTRFGTTPDQLRSASRQRTLTKARAWTAHQALVLRVASLSEVARTFGRTEGSLRESVKLHFRYP